jgi:hypothetical protein
VVSAKYNLWGGFETGESLAQKLNNALKDPYSVDGYTLVAVHAWSNSVDSLLYVNSLLDQDVRVVAPDEFVSLISEAICSPEHQNKIALRAFPNPFNDKISVHVQEYFSDDFEIFLEDLTGKFISAEIETTEILDGWIFDIKTHELPRGAYILHFSTPDEDITLKVVK